MIDEVFLIGWFSYIAAPYRFIYQTTSYYIWSIRSNIDTLVIDVYLLITFELFLQIFEGLLDLRIRHHLITLVAKIHGNLLNEMPIA